ncbi:MAG: hypothetical protein RLZZ385_1886 [Pseudomonadota bacterium]|jgi:DnaA family protein
MSAPQPCQLPLGLQLDDEATFANFHVADSNAQLLQYLAAALAMVGPRLVYLWGATGCGRSHLTQAMCHAAVSRELSAMFIPLGEQAALHPDILQGLESLSLVCLDDVDAVLGDSAWEQAIFSLYNAAQDSGLTLVVTAAGPPQQLPCELPDLRSRLQSGVVFQVHEPDEANKRALLKLRAASRGFTLDDGVLNYILLRNERSVGALMAVLDRLDTLSLQEQRPVTIPLVRQAMGW